MGQIFVPAGRYAKQSDAKKKAMQLNQSGAIKAPIFYPKKSGNAWYVAKATGKQEAGIIKLHVARNKSRRRAANKK